MGRCNGIRLSLIAKTFQLRCLLRIRDSILLGEPFRHYLFAKVNRVVGASNEWAARDERESHVLTNFFVFLEFTWVNEFMNWKMLHRWP